MSSSGCSPSRGRRLEPVGERTRPRRSRGSAMCPSGVADQDVGVQVQRRVGVAKQVAQQPRLQRARELEAVVDRGHPLVGDRVDRDVLRADQFEAVGVAQLVGAGLVEDEDGERGAGVVLRGTTR